MKSLSADRSLGGRASTDRATEQEQKPSAKTDPHGAVIPCEQGPTRPKGARGGWGRHRLVPVEADATEPLFQRHAINSSSRRDQPAK